MNPARILAFFVSFFVFISVALADKPDASPAIQKLMRDTQGAAKISVDDDTGAATFVQLPAKAMQQSRVANKNNSVAERATAFFEDYGAAFGVAEANSELRPSRVLRDATGAEHCVFRQTYDDLPVFGGELRVHFNPEGDLIAANGKFVSGLKINMTPSLSAVNAKARAVRTVIAQEIQDARAQREATDATGLSEDDFADLSAVSAELMVFRAGLVQGIPGSDHLVYEVEVRNAAITVREFVYVDAHSGKVIDQITGIHDVLDREVSESSLSNVIWDESNGDPDPIPAGWAGGDAQMVEDWNNEIDGAKETYNLIASMTAGTYLSYDAADATMRTVNNDPGISCPNANWNGVSTNYCTGVTGDDTVAHEWAHAYTEYTNNLIYQWQSGALNESYSDIWGEVVDLLNGRGTDAPGGLRSDGGCSIHGIGSPAVDDTYRWLSGEDDPAFGGAIRDMWNPVCYGDPGKVTDSEYFCSTLDNGGVHFNSGIPNHAFALMVDGGNYNGAAVTGIGLTKSAHIHWGAQNMLTPSSDFVDHADALEAACSALIGVDLPALSTSVTDAGPSGEVITAGDCATVAQINDAVEFRTPPDQCEFVPLLAKDAPELCEAVGSVETLAFEDFEGGLPAGWTASTHDIVNPATFSTLPWDVVGDLPAGANGDQAAFVADLIEGDCVVDIEAGALSLDSPVINLPDERVPRVAFDHWVATETGWDGGNVKASVNGGPWVMVPGDAYSFNPYNGSINDPNDNPLAGEEAFTGGDGGSNEGSWGQSQVNLYGVAFPGDSVQLRFDFGVDGCNGLVGWYVDEMHAYTCSAEPLPICGDGQLDPGESCDDGNMEDGDGCSVSCEEESGWLCAAPTPASDSMNILADFSFEGGVPNADWTAFSTFGGIQEFPLCGPGNGCPAASLAPTGSWLVWVGGLSAGVTSSVEQTVTIPPSADELTIQVLRGICDDPGDSLDVSLDGAIIGSLACDTTDGAFVERSFSVAGYNDGGEHVLNIGGTVGGTNGTNTNFFFDDAVIEDNIHRPAMPSVCSRIVEDLSCNAGPVAYDKGIADSWMVIDNEGTGVVWTDIASAFVGGAVPGGGNYTGGEGEAASVSSDAFIFTEFDTELRSNEFSLANAKSASLNYRVNYQNLAALDFLDLDISTDGGATWANLLSWNEDHPPGGLFTGPGEAVAIDLFDYLGEASVQLRWRYYDPNLGDWDWYAQVDNVGMSCDQTGVMVGSGRVYDDEGEKYTHGFLLNCEDDAWLNFLSIRWGKGWHSNRFFMENLDEALCSDRAGLDEGHPSAGFDTFVGSGTGLLNGQSASITFRVTDAGEPGRNGDEVEYTITDADGEEAASVSGTLKLGNHQAIQPGGH